MRIARAHFYSCSVTHKPIPHSPKYPCVCCENVTNPISTSTLPSSGIIIVTLFSDDRLV